MKTVRLLTLPRAAGIRNCMLVVAAMLILVTVYFSVSFDLMSASQYTQYLGCSEAIYNFPQDAAPFSFRTVIGDLELRTQCQAEESKCDHLREKCYNSREIFDKCGKSLPLKLLSFKRLKTRANDVELLVPNIVHYVSLGNWTFSFLNYLSFKSVYVNLQPDAIYVHGDGLPHGEWWKKMLTDVANVYFVKRDRPVRIQGRKVGWLEHSTDVMRLQTLLDNGGIYLDTDILVLKSFSTLRQYPLTLGRETSYGLGSGIIISRPHSLFVCVWMHSYRNYNPFPWNWATYAVWTPSKLSQELPSHVHIESHHLQHPTWLHSDLLFNGVYDWSDNYAMHIWKRYGNVPQNPEQIKALNTTLGEVMRFIYYGSKQLILDSQGVDESGEFGTRWSFSTAIDLVGHRILEFVRFNT